MRDYMEIAFLEVWNRKGKRYMTRAQIAKHFGKSAFWVQWMFVKTGARPRTRSPSVKLREETGIDNRLKYIEEMKFKSAMNASIKKLIIRTAELKAARWTDRDFLKRITYLGKTIDAVQGHIVTVEEFDSDWPSIKTAENAIDKAVVVYADAIERSGRKKK